MKPGDHPDFFRFPAPEGRSRESSIVLDAEGRFWHDGARIEHPGMAQAFATWIARHPDDGRFILTNGYDWTYLRVEDAPFFVRAVRVDDGGAVLVLSDGNEEALDPSTLSVGRGDAVYVRVKAGRFEARCMPEAQTQLLPLLVEGREGEVFIELDGQRFAIGTRDESARAPT